MFARLAALTLLLFGVVGYAQDTKPVEKSERELILSLGVKMGDLNRVYLSIREELDKQPAESKGKKNWDSFTKDLKDQLAKVSTDINDPKFQAKASLEALARLERELMVWQALEEERRGKNARANAPTSPLLGGILPSGPTVNLVQYDPIQMAALELLQNPEKLKALQLQWQKAYGIPGPKAGEPYGKTLQKWMMDEQQKKGLNQQPPKK